MVGENVERGVTLYTNCFNEEEPVMFALFAAFAVEQPMDWTFF